MNLQNPWRSQYANLCFVDINFLDHKKIDQYSPAKVWSNLNANTMIDQFRRIKIQPNTIDLCTRLWGINRTNSVVIPQSLVLRSIVLGWILIYRNWSIAAQILASKFCLTIVYAHVHVAVRYHSWLPAETITFLLTDGLPLWNKSIVEHKI